MAVEANRQGEYVSVQKSLQVRDVPIPVVGPDEVLIEVVASSINFNTVWTARFSPVSTFRFLDEYAASSPRKSKHKLDYHIVGSDASGIIREIGSEVDGWQVGDAVVAHCLVVELQSPLGHDDALLDPGQKIWGYETNFGGLAEYTVVKANQVLGKVPHLTWEESASTGLVCSTAYRQLVSRNGANMKQGDLVLIWGAAGGLGSYASQFVANGGGYPIAVVSGSDRANFVRSLGVEMVIDRQANEYQFIDDAGQQDPREWRRFRRDIRALTGGEDPDIVFEHTGRQTFGASVYVAKKGGTIVTCASTSGYWHEYDNRYLWMNVKKIIGTHFANYREAFEANELVRKGAIRPTVTQVFPLQSVGDACDLVATNSHIGKVAVRCGGEQFGDGITDTRKRQSFLQSSG